jgi:hypothetical protein
MPIKHHLDLNRGLLFLLGGGIGEVLGLGKTASELGLCPK